MLSDELADVQRVLPALEALATPAMRDRHWHKVVALLGLDQACAPLVPHIPNPEPLEA